MGRERETVVNYIINENNTNKKSNKTTHKYIQTIIKKNTYTKISLQILLL